MGATTDRYEHEPVFHLTVGRAEKALKGEDAILQDDELKLYGVFDGLGGEGSGDVAATLARDSIAGYVREQAGRIDYGDCDLVTRHLQLAFEEAESAMERKVKEGQVSPSMATTASVLYFFTNAGQLMAAKGHVGDSRIYRYRPDEGIIRLTQDEGSGSLLYNVIMAGGGTKHEQFGTCSVRSNDRFMICSDGITGDCEDQALERDEFEDAFSRPDPQESAEAFLDYSAKRDDKSVLVIEVQ